MPPALVACSTNTEMFSKDTVVNALDEQLTSTATITERWVDGGERWAEPMVTVVPRGEVAALAVLVETVDSATSSAASIPTREIRMTTSISCGHLRLLIQPTIGLPTSRSPSFSSRRQLRHEPPTELVRIHGCLDHSILLPP
jgi:hypothetical protein